MSVSQLNASVDSEALSPSDHFHQGKFHNKVPTAEFEWGKLWKMVKRSMFSDNPRTTPDTQVPVQHISPQQLQDTQEDTIWRLGHSSLLLKISGEYWLLDPVFSERASPVGFMGPKRFHQPPISIEALPPLAGVLISHNHYDHLDKASVRQLADKTQRFIVPLGVGDDLVSWGIAEAKVHQLDWWQSHGSAKIKVTATPAHHFSGRGLSDRDKTLWASYVIDSGDTKVFFSGDSGYFDGFKAIGERMGPFDLTLVETGAYDPLWADVHMHPSQSLQAHLDLNGHRMMPIHNGTFNLAFHAWDDPFDQISALAAEHWVDLVTPVMGEAFAIKGDNHTRRWWQSL